MTTNNDKINKEEQNLNITTTDPLEENLSWLQDFHIKTIGLLTKNDQYIQDSSIGRYLGYNNYISLKDISNVRFRIYAVDNPGFVLDFNDDIKQISNITSHQLPIDIEEKTDRVVEDSYPEELETESLFINSKDYFYDSFSSALYLNISIEFFKSCIDSDEIPITGSLTSMRNRYKQNNPLLTWLEEFYFSCCDGDWEHDTGGGIGLIATNNGWIFCFSVLYLDVVDKSFDSVLLEQEEGVIECYKKEEFFSNTKSYSRFIIRAHPRGLITGLKLFKEWVES